MVDIGLTRVEGDGGKAKLIGDVHPSVADVAGYLSPVPGGVGLLTRGMLLVNLIELAESAT